jgi:chromosome partitioning protein
MGERKVYRRALTQGQAVAEFDPNSKAAREIKKLWKEIEQLGPAAQDRRAA